MEVEFVIPPGLCELASAGEQTFDELFKFEKVFCPPPYEKSTINPKGAIMM
jgi:hypothetical protein